MTTRIRAELSEKNPYWIEKHRYYELKHFCMQYPIWKKIYAAINGLNTKTLEIVTRNVTNNISDPTAKYAIIKVFYSNRINMIEKVAYSTDESLKDYILKGVTEGISYDILKARLEIPCCRDTYYELYRRFFWLLDKERQ